MDARKQLIFVNGKDKTDSIASCRKHGGKYEIVYEKSPRVYSYDPANVRILKLRGTLDPKTIIFKARGYVIADIDRILDFGDYYRVIRAGRNDLTIRREEVSFFQNALAEPDNQQRFQYFRETAEAVSLVTDSGTNILSLQYSRISALDSETVLAKYFKPRKQPELRDCPTTLIYPFGMNRSQKTAVENAFSSQVSMIQGPPGTGKTQTILNIVANAVYHGKTVAVVSNNNSAISNVAERLSGHNLSFLTAFLGSLQNKEKFLGAQTGAYPNLRSWMLSDQKRENLDAEVESLIRELNTMLGCQNRIAAIGQELLELQPEQQYFCQYDAAHPRARINAPTLRELPSAKLVSAWVEYEHMQKFGLWQKLCTALRYGRASLTVFRYPPKDAVPFFQDLYYKTRIQELQAERRWLEAKLRNFQFEKKMRQLSQKSLRLLQAELARRYPWQGPRPCFEKKDFRSHAEAFNREYPVILSTTYSIKGTLSTEHIYDYLIIDEASQVDLATGVLALSCAKNVVIVGDRQQLPNVLTPEDIQKADEVWNRCKLDERYHFATHSLLDSAAEIWKTAPVTLLREHYRCHPKIAGFFNRKFYDDKLLVMTEDRGEPEVLSVYRTMQNAPTHSHSNQQQIDVICDTVLPHLEQQGYAQIGMITPYREQVTALHKQLGEQYEIATVHKFQGREKDAIVLTSVDDQITDFTDDPHMLNVAVSRAIKSLSVVISGNSRNENTNYGDLLRYIAYHNFDRPANAAYPVSALLYQRYSQQRMQYLEKHHRLSELEPEERAFTMIEKILNMPECAHLDCAAQVPLAALIRDASVLTQQEADYAADPFHKVDFLLYHRMDKSPVLAVDASQTKTDLLPKSGIPAIQIRADKRGEGRRILAVLKKQQQ